MEMQDLQKGASVEFTVPAHREKAEIEDTYPDGTAKLRIWVHYDDHVQIHRFVTVPLKELTFLER